MKNIINGQWVDSTSTNVMDVINPATGDIIDTVPIGNAVDADNAILAAHHAFQSWRKTSTEERARIQHAAANLMRQNADMLAELLSQELGRNPNGSKNEVLNGAKMMDFFAEEGIRIKGEIPMMGLNSEQVLVVKEPLGVAVAITPFNFPIALLIIKIGAALIAGCTVVIKPSEDTPLTTLKLVDLFNQAGYPDGVINVVTGYGHDLGQALVAHPIPHKVAFTGSTRVGQLIAATAAKTSKRVTLELGGQCPAIIASDADLETIFPKILNQSFLNTGQFCYRINRYYVHADIYDVFVKEFAERASKLSVGDTLKNACDLGPMINQKLYENSASHIADAREKGAKIACGGERLVGADYDTGYFLPPTIIYDANHSMKIMTEETFGPVVGVMPYTIVEEAIDYANDTIYGLAAYVFSQDIGTVMQASTSIEAGSVWVNDCHLAYDLAPFGGMKQSGVGRVKSHYGIEEYLETKTIYLNY